MSPRSPLTVFTSKYRWYYIINYHPTLTDLLPPGARASSSLLHIFLWVPMGPGLLVGFPCPSPHSSARIHGFYCDCSPAPQSLLSHQVLCSLPLLWKLCSAILHGKKLEKMSLLLYSIHCCNKIMKAGNFIKKKGLFNSEVWRSNMYVPLIESEHCIEAERISTCGRDQL